MAIFGYSANSAGVGLGHTFFESSTEGYSATGCAPEISFFTQQLPLYARPSNPGKLHRIASLFSLLVYPEEKFPPNDIF